MLTYTKDMRIIKGKFIEQFAQTMREHLFEWKKKQSDARRSLYSWDSIKWYGLAFLFGFIPGKHERHYSLKCHCSIAVILFIVAIIINIQLTNKSYQNDIKKTFFSKIIKLFGDKIKYASGYDGTTTFCIPKRILVDSSLYNKEIEYKNYDDKFGGLYKDVNFNINEIEFGWLGKDNNGKKTIENKLFKGLALFFKMNKTIKNRVLIISKHCFFKVPKRYQKVEVEYEKFSKKYNVYVDSLSTDSTSAQIEARYLLNTAFLDRFMQIQTSFRVSKIQCSIYGNELLIMLSTGRDLFEMNHLFGRIDDINQYEHLFNEFASIFSFIDVLNLSSKTKL